CVCVSGEIGGGEGETEAGEAEEVAGGGEAGGMAVAENGHGSVRCTIDGIGGGDIGEAGSVAPQVDVDEVVGGGEGWVGERREVMFEQGVAVGREGHAIEGDGIGAGGSFPEIGQAVLVGIERGGPAVQEPIAAVAESRLNLVCIQSSVWACG